MASSLIRPKKAQGVKPPSLTGGNRILGKDKTKGCLLIGLTGTMGSGKSKILEMFQELGAKTFSADSEVSHLLNQPEVIKQIVKHMGTEILKGDGQIDRAILARKVFKSKKKKMELESILHPLVFQALMDFCQKNPGQVILAEIPLLFETDSQHLFDKIITVQVPRDLAVERLLKRGMELEDINLRLAHQLPLEDKIRMSDYVIDNSKGLDRTREQVAKIWDQLRSKRSKKGTSGGGNGNLTP